MTGTVLKWFFGAAFLIAVILSGIFSGLMSAAGLFYLVCGSIAAALAGFSHREIGTAFRLAAGRPGQPEALSRAAYFWEAAARNAWILGVLGSSLNFTIALGSESGGINNVVTRVIQSFLVTLYGLILAVVCLVPAMKLSGRTERASAPEPSGPAAAGPGAFERAIGYALFAVVLGATIISLSGGSPQAGPLPAAKVLLHWPAALVVFGGALALALFAGPGVGARGLTLGFSMTGLISLLAGFLQALFGFANRNIGEIAQAISFIIAASAFALLGLVIVAAPLEDREVMEGRRALPSPLSRMFWAAFPLLTFIFLLLALIMVITPMEKTAG